MITNIDDLLHITQVFTVSSVFLTGKHNVISNLVLLERKLPVRLIPCYLVYRVHRSVLTLLLAKCPIPLVIQTVNATKLGPV